MDSTTKAGILHDILYMWQAVDNGVTHQTSKTRQNTGLISKHTRENLDATLISLTPLNLNNKSSFPLLLLGSGQDTTAEELRSRFLLLQRPWRLPQRPLNWLENEAPSTKKQKNTASH
eukprot:6656254-Ditylum_brightwellii.AAC.1